MGQKNKAKERNYNKKDIKYYIKTSKNQNNKKKILIRLLHN